MTQQGSRLFQVTGILMVGATLVPVLLSLMGLATSIGMLGSTPDMPFVVAVLVGVVLLQLYQMVAGCLAVAFWSKPWRGKLCIILGVVLVAVSLLLLPLELATSDIFALAALRVALALLYVFGAQRLKNLNHVDIPPAEF